MAQARRLMNRVGIGGTGAAGRLGRGNSHLMVVPTSRALVRSDRCHWFDCTSLRHWTRAACARWMSARPYIRSRHVLYGALSVPECGVAKALARRGVHASDVDNWDASSAPGRPANILAGATADTVPEPGDGRVRKADRLGIAADVEMLVSVLLAAIRRCHWPLAYSATGAVARASSWPSCRNASANSPSSRPRESRRLGLSAERSARYDSMPGTTLTQTCGRAWRRPCSTNGPGGSRRKRR